MKHTTRTHSFIAANQMQFINNEQADCLNIFPLLPAARQHVPFIWCAHNYVSLYRTQQINYHYWFDKRDRIRLILFDSDCQYQLLGLND